MSKNSSIDEERRGVIKECAKCRKGAGGKRGFVDSLLHQLNPSIAGAVVNGEWSVAHPQSRMAALLGICLRAAKALHDKFAKPLLGAGEVVLWIKRAENFIGWDALVKVGNETGQTLLADELEKLRVEKV